MITVEEAFKIASENSLGVKLSPKPYDFGDCWCFDYSGDEDITGFRPMIIKKQDGSIIPFNFPDDEMRLLEASIVTD